VTGDLEAMPYLSPTSVVLWDVDLPQFVLFFHYRELVDKDFSELDLPILGSCLHPTIIFLFDNDMESEVSIAGQVERFEDYCLRKWSLEADIEMALARRDEKAVESIDLAELELENKKRQCVALKARVKAALQGNLGEGEKSRLPSETRRNGLRVAVEEGVIPHTNTSGTIDASSSSTDRQNRSRPSDHFEDDSSDESLTLLVQRYTDMCHERRMLQEEIGDRLEREERMAAERIRCAKIALETTRQKAVEIVAALNETSGGDTKISLPAGTIDTLGTKVDPVDMDGVSESGPRATENSPQQGVPNHPPHLRTPGGGDTPHPSNASRRLSNNSSIRGPPGNQLGVRGSPHVAPWQQPVPPPQTTPGIPNAMQNYVAAGAPRVFGQAPQPAPGRGPHGNGMQGIPPFMMQGPGPSPYVSSILTNLLVTHAPLL